MATTVKIGRIQPIWRGDYDSNFQYTPLDFLSYADGLFLCIAPAKNILPTDTNYFRNVVSAENIRAAPAWNSMTGPASPPRLSYHASKYWMLTNSVADVQTEEPGVSEYWEQVATQEALDQAVSNIQATVNNGNFVRYDLNAEQVTGTLDLATSNVFRLDASSAVTVTLTNIPAAGRGMSVMVHVIGPGPVTWPTAIIWDEGEPPEIGDNFTRVCLVWDGVEWTGFGGAPR